MRPDIMIVCNEVEGNYLSIPPDLIIEILLPNNLKKDRVIKFELYREQGVKYYLMVNVEKEEVEVYELIDNYYKQVEKETFKLSKNCVLNLDFTNLLEIVYKLFHSY